MVSIQNPADLTAPSKEFTFDSAYDPKSTTECIYNDICYPLVEVSFCRMVFIILFYQEIHRFVDRKLLCEFKTCTTKGGLYVTQKQF